LLRLSHPDTRTARNELRAIKKLCDGGHKNIIKVFDFGELPDASHIFIDMELCSLNLDEYNKSLRTAFVVHESISSLRSEQIWDIIIQIADALAFIHGHHEVHRDLKPQNGPCPLIRSLTLPVLYSLVDRLWKVADFGLTSEGSSNSFHNTQYCRGTPGYRAPELLKDGEILYNNKVDIWALGCILYELVVGAKAFVSDSSVHQHYESGSRLEIKIDETLDAYSTTLFPKAILEMLQQDPDARPTAATLLHAWSMHRLVKTKSLNLSHANTPGTTSEAQSAKISEPLPVFRKFLEPTHRGFSPDPGMDEREWTVFFALINSSNTRVVTESCDVDREFCRVTLWDASGTAFWELNLEYPLAGIRSRANSTFSSDGESFGVHSRGKTILRFNATTTEPYSPFDVKFGDGHIMAIAITTNGKGMAVAIAETARDGLGCLSPPSLREVGSLATLTDADKDQPNVDVIRTRQLSNISLAYDSRGRRLLLVGSYGDYQRFAICWDTITKGALMTNLSPHDSVVSTWFSPLYSLPSNSLTFLRGLQWWNEFCLMAFPTFSNASAMFRTGIQVIRFYSYGVFGVRHSSILIITNEETIDVWDAKLGDWRRHDNLTPKDPGDKTPYKYLWKCGEKDPTEFSIIAKIAWDNMPSLGEIKGMAETDDGLTLIMEDETLRK